MYENSYNMATVKDLATHTYVLGVVLALFFVVLSLVVASAIDYEGGKNPTDAKRRRMWFFIFAALGPVLFFFWNFFYVSEKVKGEPAVAEFLKQNAIATVICLVVYLGLGFVLSKAMKKSKYGTLFP